MASNGLQARLDGDTLHLSGVLDRQAVTAVWPQVQALAGRYQRLDLSAVPRLDSAGVALLAELATRVRAQGQALAVQGTPEGFNELRAAYRLGADLDFQATSAAS